jgi:hypothetical protein
VSKENRTLRQERTRFKHGVRTKLPAKFVPRFWIEADRRTAIAREIIGRVKALKESVGADSPQKELLVERCAFIALQLESAEVGAIEGEPYDQGSYVQSVNCLIGLLKVLGLERKVKNITDLKTYMRERNGK